MINIVNELDKNYGLMKLFKANIIPWTVLRDRDIYLQYDIYIKTGLAEMDAKEQTAMTFKVSTQTVYRAIWKMKDEENSNPS
jgi:hypothetical protein